MNYTLLDAQSNPLEPLMKLIGFGIAMVILFIWFRKKDAKTNLKDEDDKNKMK